MGILEMDLLKDQKRFTLFSSSLLSGGANLGGEPGSTMAGGREVVGRSGRDSCHVCLWQLGYLEKVENLEGQDITLMYSFKKCRNTVSVR